MKAGDLRPIGRDTQGVTADGPRRGRSARVDCDADASRRMTEPELCRAGNGPRPREPQAEEVTVNALRRFEPRVARQQLLGADGGELHRDLEVVALILDGDDGADAELPVADAHAGAHAAVRGLIFVLVRERPLPGPRGACGRCG